MIRHVIVLLIIVIYSSSLPAQDVRRCVQSDGSIIITDGVCASDTIEKSTVPAPVLRTPGLPKRAGIRTPPSCNASAEDLQYSVRTAIDMRDINQLAKHYHWLGVSNEQAEKLMDRLEQLLLQPVLDIQLQHPQSTTESKPEMDYQSLGEQAPSNVIQMPYGLKITQYRSNNNDALQSTSFRLQQHFNCWWIRY